MPCRDCVRSLRAGKLRCVVCGVCVRCDDA